MNALIEESSFRDRDGFVFTEDNKLFRAIRPSYFSTWDLLTSSGFLAELTAAGKMAKYHDAPVPSAFQSSPVRVLEVEKIPVISYPSEWTFSQLKKAALLTLDLQLEALKKNFSLKDASAFNVQFRANKPVFIDLLSFELYEEGSPWIAYRQFCTHFLCPLLLHKFKVPGVRHLLSAYIDGIPPEVCSGLLPWRSRFNLLAFTHVHMHSRFQKKHEGSDKRVVSKLRLPKKRLETMLLHMRDAIKNMRAGKNETNWTSYYDDFSYTPEGFEFKKQFVSDALGSAHPRMCLDLGCNTGEFSRIASGYAELVISCDNDEHVVSMVQDKKLKNVLALCVDLVDPTPARGWDHSERKSFFSRTGDADSVLALALVHHLSIGANVPFSRLAKFFSRFKNQIIIEFVPKNDPQVKRLLVSRKDVFPDYTVENFVASFEEYFLVEKRATVPGCSREMFLMKRKSQ